MAWYGSIIGNYYFQYRLLLNSVMNKLFDLRFVIGLFFLVIGLLLIFYGLISTGKENAINWICGLLFTAFAIFMLWLARGKQKGTA